MDVTFWGSRGSVPCYTRDKVHFGTNTSSVQVRLAGGECILLDAGTGLVALGDQMWKTGLSDCDTVHLFMTHFHWDHIQGLPFFKPIYRKGMKLAIYGPPGVEAVLSGQIVPPFCPIPREAMAADIEFVTVKDGVRVGDARVTCFPTNHPQGCFGYSLEAGGKKVCYATDLEPDGGRMDDVLLQAARGSDLLIHDSTDSLEEAPNRKGWGHSTWRDCVRTAKASGSGQLVLFHHDAFEDDDAVRRKEALAKAEFSRCQCAFDGLKVSL